FIGPIKPSWMAAVRRTGAEPREPFGGFTWVVRANAGMVSRILELPYVLGLCHLPHRDRIAVKTELRAAQLPSARGARQASVFEDIYIVTFFGEDDLKKAMPQVKWLGFKVRDRVRNLLVA